MELELKSLELELKSGIELFATATAALTIVYQPFPNLALTEEVIIFHVADSSCNRFVF